MKLHLFKEGLIPITNKELKDIYVNENVHPNFIDELEYEYDIVFNTESGFNTFKFLKESDGKWTVFRYVCFGLQYFLIT